MLENAVGLQEAVELNASQSQHFTQFWFADSSRSQFFECKRLQRPPRQVITRLGQMGGNCIRYS